MSEYEYEKMVRVWNRQSLLVNMLKAAAFFGAIAAIIYFLR